MDERVVRALREAQHVVVLTGSGASAESGVPTFRESQVGLWERFDAMELATPAAFRRDPALVWGWYEWRRKVVLTAQPNAGHRALAALAQRVPHFTAVTQNVDDLHERAGSAAVLHLHGELARPHCEACQRPYVFPAGIPDVPEEGARIEPPRCEACGARVRPGVVWFGERLPEAPWRQAREAAENCNVFLCVGTSALVYPAASLAQFAIAAGAVVVEINPNPAELGAGVITLRGTAGAVLPQLIDVAVVVVGKSL
jgi:NAD-dependent deacetylase